MESTKKNEKRIRSYGSPGSPRKKVENFDLNGQKSRLFWKLSENERKLAKKCFFFFEMKKESKILLCASSRNFKANFDLNQTNCKQNWFNIPSQKSRTTVLGDNFDDLSSCGRILLYKWGFFHNHQPLFCCFFFRLFWTVLRDSCFHSWGNNIKGQRLNHGRNIIQVTWLYCDFVFVLCCFCNKLMTHNHLCFSENSARTFFVFQNRKNFVLDWWHILTHLHFSSARLFFLPSIFTSARHLAEDVIARLGARTPWDARAVRTRAKAFMKARGGAKRENFARFLLSTRAQFWKCDFRWILLLLR